MGPLLLLLLLLLVLLVLLVVVEEAELVVKLEVAGVGTGDGRVAGVGTGTLFATPPRAKEESAEATAAEAACASPPAKLPFMAPIIGAVGGAGISVAGSML